MKIGVLPRLPLNLASRAFGRFARIPFPPFVMRRIVRAYIRVCGVNEEEIRLPLDAFPTLDAFFTREIKPELRPVDNGPNRIVSPVDGTLGQSGTIGGGELLQAKGVGYPLGALVPSPRAAAFERGSYLTFYLSPRDGHRVFSPFEGTVTGCTRVPGTLLPVRSPYVDRVPGLFTRNERLITYLETGRGPVAVVAVGAFNVGRITAAYDPDIATNTARGRLLERFYEEGVPVERGGLLAVFHLGSTVILLLPGPVRRMEDVRPGAPALAGRAVAEWI